MNNKILLAYIVGAVLTKIALNGTGLDTTQNLVEWPVLWFNNPRGMLGRLVGQPEGVNVGGWTVTPPGGYAQGLHARPCSC